MKEYRWKINDEYHIRSMSAEEFEPLFQKYTKQFFDDETQVFRLREALSEEERGRLKKLSANLGEPFELRLGVFHGDEFVGWHYGRQDSYVQFYMQNSGILPEHRRKGLYAELVKRVLEVTTAMEVTDIFGTLIHLYYFPKEIRRKMMDYRVGQIKPDQEIKKSLGI